MNQGIDLQGSFVRALVDLGLPTGVGKNPLAALTYGPDFNRCYGQHFCHRLV